MVLSGVGPAGRAAHMHRTAGVNSTTRQRAFSLIELSLVVATIAVLAAIAIPRYANATARYRADAAARRVVADLTLAQNRAVTRNVGQVVAFSATGYELQGMADPSRPTVPYRVDLTADPYGAKLVSPTFGAATVVTFTAYGTPDIDAALEFKLAVGGHQRTVTLDAGSGRAKVVP